MYGHRRRQVAVVLRVRLGVASRCRRIELELGAEHRREAELARARSTWRFSTWRGDGPTGEPSCQCDVGEDERGRLEPRDPPQRREVGPQHEVAVAVLPARDRVAGDRIHLHVEREQVVAALDPVLGDVLEEELAVHALAHQPALHVGERDDDGVDRLVRACSSSSVSIARVYAASVRSSRCSRRRSPRESGRAGASPLSRSAAGSRTATSRSTSAASASSCGSAARTRSCSGSTGGRARRPRSSPRSSASGRRSSRSSSRRATSSRGSSRADRPARGVRRPRRCSARSPRRCGASTRGRRSPAGSTAFRVVEAYSRDRGRARRRVPGRLRAARTSGADRIERARGPAAAPPCHNDLLNANFIADGERIRIVDWEYAGHGRPLLRPRQLLRQPRARRRGERGAARGLLRRRRPGRTWPHCG